MARQDRRQPELGQGLGREPGPAGAQVTQITPATQPPVLTHTASQNSGLVIRHLIDQYKAKCLVCLSPIFTLRPKSTFFYSKSDINHLS